ncbi:MAG: hypothetical protein U0174_23355 [Polyangiaceae bacterium]
MKMFLAAAAVMAFGSLGVACASEGPTEDDVVTIDGNEGRDRPQRPSPLPRLRRSRRSAASELAGASSFASYR